MNPLLLRPRIIQNPGFAEERHSPTGGFGDLLDSAESSAQPNRAEVSLSWALLAVKQNLSLQAEMHLQPERRYF
ncbi:MAG: hypothetical protein A2508_00055 [Candidatus Lambdaproteobacteria bacterium RIFOXYD12_FULL_49_8]|uniref:Uncharacterized protein n=1 Tax=Candidatus Lambdaproteobacteria bacterium RIFOXYD2_FULL_50_16 TaxID=1817772 RepID=A0A1F6GAB0_9PROT|nr:MAG: hypothetical protein A2527_12540 [Candidatus Lambdaproteobacteria bacterium RIFOXYD2_FULL_50_16]OGG97502.1 MAG: hypothetical protein A2508_00055 [Candidatus Lambdaproteobacteria bacterium RIFOXYD12_FULL_49_8]